MIKDDERIKRLLSSLEKYKVDALLVDDEVNIRYIVGEPVDYSLAYMLNDGEIGIITPLLEFERASKETWADEIHVFSSKESGEDVIKTSNYFEAFYKLYPSIGNIAVPFSKISYSKFIEVKKMLRNVNIVDGDQIIMNSRMIKTDVEMKYLRKAADIVDKGVWKGVEELREGVAEKYIAYVSGCYMRECGADKIYDFLIVASGERSALPHGRASDKIVKRGEDVTLDYVASYNGYYGDETRTVFLGRPSSELRKIYEIVLSAQLEGINRVEEGVSSKDIDDAARNVIERSGYGKYFIHSTGHGLGLEVHEEPRISSEKEILLRKGMVITVEPGIYIPGLGGIRIEDDVLVTSRGHDVITRNPKMLDSVILS